MFILTKEQDRWIVKDAGKLKKWWGDKANLSRRLSEGVFDDYGTAMEKLREVDDSIQSWTADLQDCLKKASAALSNDKFMDCLYWLSQINARLKLASKKIPEISTIQDSQLQEYYQKSSENIPEDYFSGDESHIVRKAGLQDLLPEGAKKWMTSRHLQKMFKQRLAAQKLALRTLMREVRRVVGVATFSLSSMAQNRAQGNIDAYLSNLQKISKAQQVFENQFQNIYNQHFKQVADQMRQQQATKQPAPEIPAEKMPETVPGAPYIPEDKVDSIPLTEIEPTSAEMEKIPDTEVAPLTMRSIPSPPISQPNIPFNLEKSKQINNQPVTPDPIIDVPGVKEEPILGKPVLDVDGLSQSGDMKNTQRSNQTFPTKEYPNKKANEQFLIELSKISSPREQGLKLLAYSEYLENVNPQQSLQMLALAEGLLEDI